MSTLQDVVDQDERISYGDIASSPLSADSQLCNEIQAILARSNFYTDRVDGIFGSNTLSALRKFKAARSLGGGDVLGSTTASYLLHARDTSLGSAQPSSRDETQQAIIDECKRLGLIFNNQIAYVLATVEHETANTFEPVREAFWLSEDWRRQNLWYYPYYGRGYVQLTHKGNYQIYSDLLGIDLVNNPDSAMQPNVALFVLVDGMAHGRFTGLNLGAYVNATQTDFYNARRVVNGLDQASHIADLAGHWLSAIS